MTGAQFVWLAGHLVLALVVLGELAEPGPSATSVIARRYGPAVLLVGPAWAALVAAGLWWGPAATVAVVVVVGGAVAALAVLRWGPWSLWRAARRVVLRARFTSAARACGLCVVEVRPPGIGGTDTATITSAARLEHVPAVWGGRALPAGVGVRYRVSPARGGTVEQIGERAEHLAAALHVGRVTVHRDRPDRGELVVLWRPEAEL